MASFCYVLAVVGSLLITPALAIASNSSSSCGPSNRIAIDGSPLGVPLATAWAKDYQKICNDTIITVSSSSSSVGAQRVCNVTPALRNAVDIGILSRPFLPSEAATKDGYNYQCVKGSPKPRTTIQVEAAIDAVVLVVAPKGLAANCIDQVFGKGLTWERLRILYSSYCIPEKIILNNTEWWTPGSRIVPPAVPVVPTTAEKIAPPPAPVSPPTLSPGISRRNSVPTPTAKPTLRPCTIIRVWQQIKTKSIISCGQIPVLIAGPPSSSDVFQNFASKILPDFGKGETVDSRYYSSASPAKLLSYLQSNTNAIGFMSLSDYTGFQRKLVAVNIKSANGTNYAPNTAALTSGLYPLGYNLYMEVRSDNSTTLRSIRPFFDFAYSAQGDIDVVKSGLVPITNPRKAQMLSRLGVISSTPTTAPVAANSTAPPK